MLLVLPLNSAPYCENILNEILSDADEMDILRPPYEGIPLLSYEKDYSIRIDYAGDYDSSLHLFRIFCAMGEFCRRWTHVRYKGSISFEPISPEAVEVTIQSADRGDAARVLSSFLGWLDRHFGNQLSSIKIEYWQAAARRRHLP